MFGSTDQHIWTTLLQRLTGVLDDMQSVGLATLSGEQELDVMRDLETQRNRMATVEHRLIADTEARGTARELACRSTATLLSQLLRISPKDAADRVRDAANFGPRRGLTGEVLPPLFEKVAAAQGTGEISTAHARVVTKTINDLPDAVQVENEDWLQESLLEQAHSVSPGQLASVARAMSYLLDQDGVYTDEQERHRRRDLRIKRRTDGSARIEGELTAMCAEALLSVLGPLAKPAPAQDGAKDPRTCGQRMHDALHDAMMIALRSGQLPDCGGVAATILLTMTPEQFENRGAGWSGPGTAPTSPSMRR